MAIILKIRRGSQKKSKKAVKGIFKNLLCLIFLDRWTYKKKNLKRLKKIEKRQMPFFALSSYYFAEQ